MTVLPVLRDARTYSFFFDFDGTLTEIAETPGAVIVEERAREALETLFESGSGAVAIVTGREIDSIDKLLAPLKLPVAGVHGYERRNGETTVSAAAAEESAARKYSLPSSIIIPVFFWRGSAARLPCTTVYVRNLNPSACPWPKTLPTGSGTSS